MKAVQVSGSLPRYGLARVAGSIAPGLGARVGPLSLVEAQEPELPGPGWHRLHPRLAGICGSDLATVDGRSSPYFQPLVSFPFVLGHEIVADRADGSEPGTHRVVVEPVLACAARSVHPPCRQCAEGRTDCCERTAYGHLKPGLQTGYCADTGGGWSTSMVAHESQLHPVPDELGDDAAVMVEPAACAIHGVMGVPDGATVLVLGAGTLGLCAIAALRRFTAPGTVVASAKHPEQRRWARQLGADVVVEPAESHRLVRRATRSLQVGGSLSGGVDVVIDCVGSAASVEEDLAVARPGGDVVLLGMPSVVTVDLTPLWHRQVRVRGSYAYGTETRHGAPVRTFDLAFELVAGAGLGRLVSARYPLDRYREAIEHAANAGSRGAVKVAFDLRGEKRR